MCYQCNQAEISKWTNWINITYRDEGKRWALIKNASGNLELIPETALKGLKKITIVYKLKSK